MLDRIRSSVWVEKLSGHMIGVRSDLLSCVVLVEWVVYWSVWYFEGIVYFGFWCTLDLVVKYVKLYLRSNCMSADIVIIFIFFARPVRGYSPAAG